MKLTKTAGTSADCTFCQSFADTFGLTTGASHVSDKLGGHDEEHRARCWAVSLDTDGFVR